MEPSHIPVINLCKAELMRVELLIQVLSFHVHIYLQHITTQEQSNTVKCLDPGSDIMEHLEDHVYDEILELNTHILDTLPKEEIVCS